METSGKTPECSGPPPILAIKLSSLGDLFHALPAVQIIQKTFQAPVDWVTQPEYADLVACFGGIRRVIVFPRRNFRAGFWNFARALRRHRYGYILDFQGLLKSALVSRLARGEVRVGPSFAREGTRLFYSRLAGPPRRDRHALEECLDFAEALGADRGEGRPIFPFRFPPFVIPAEAPRPWIAVSPFTRWSSKNWPLRHLTGVISALGDKTRGSFHLIGGTVDRTLFEGVISALRCPVFNWAGTVTLPQLGSLLGQMDLMISSDTGPMHMAAALGVPVVATFGPTDPARTGPFGTRYEVVIRKDLTCRPCFQRECPLDSDAPPCRVEVNPEEVVAAALRLLREVG